MSIFSQMFHNARQKVLAAKAEKLAAQRREHFLHMSPGELADLTDPADRYDAAWARTDARVTAAGSTEQGLETLSVEQQVFYIPARFAAELEQGGLSGFLARSGPALAPALTMCLAALDAAEQQACLEQALEKAGIDPDDPATYPAEGTDFGDYDRARAALPPIREALDAYLENMLPCF